MAEKETDVKTNEVKTNEVKTKSGELPDILTLESAEAIAGKDKGRELYDKVALNGGFGVFDANFIGGLPALDIKNASTEVKNKLKELF